MGSHNEQPSNQAIDPRNVDYHEIARRGDTEVMQALLQAGLDPGLRDPRGYDLLMIAAYSGHADMVDLLLSHDADPDGRDPAGNTPLIGLGFKGFPDVARKLLAGGADPDARNGAGATALHFAAMFRQEALLDILLEHGADTTIVDSQGNTPADVAQGHGHADIAERLETA